MARPIPESVRMLKWGFSQKDAPEGYAWLFDYNDKKVLDHPLPYNDVLWLRYKHNNALEAAFYASSGAEVALAVGTAVLPEISGESPAATA